MTATYSITDLATVPKDQVRLLIGDTDMSSVLLQDEEISFILSLMQSVYAAAANVCLSLAGKFSRLADHSQGTIRTNHSQKSKNYLELYVKYSNLAKSAGAPLPYSGGISLADKAANELDPDRNAPPFAVGQDDNLTMPVAPNDLQTLTAVESDTDTGL